MLKFIDGACKGIACAVALALCSVAGLTVAALVKYVAEMSPWSIPVGILTIAAVVGGTLEVRK